MAKASSSTTPRCATAARPRTSSFTLEDKLRIAERLDDLGIHYIEGGWPGSNPRDEEFFRAVRAARLKHAKVAAFGSTRRAGVARRATTATSTLLPARRHAGRDHRRQDLGPARARRPAHPARGEPRAHRRLGRAT